MHRTLAAIAVAALSTGCATLNPRVLSYASFGEADPAGDRAVIAAYDAALEAPAEGAQPEVKVLMDMVPAGITVKENTVSVDDGAPYHLVGKLVLGVRQGFFFSDYRDGWRKPLCYPQDVLVAFTLGVWALVPSYWACMVDRQMTRDEVIGAVKRVARAAGANLVLFTYLGGSASTESVGGGRGILLKTNASSSDPRRAPPVDTRVSPAEASTPTPAGAPGV